MPKAQYIETTEKGRAISDSAILNYLLQLFLLSNLLLSCLSKTELLEPGTVRATIHAGYVNIN